MLLGQIFWIKPEESSAKNFGPLVLLKKEMKFPFEIYGTKKKERILHYILDF